MNPYSLLVGMQNDTTPMENRMQVLKQNKTTQKTKKNSLSTVLSSSHTSGLYLKEMIVVSQKDTCMPTCTTILFTIGQIWKQPTGRRTDE